jgi:hypothetical protein
MRVMTRLFVRHNVADYKLWRKAYDDFDAERKALGVTGHAVFQSIDDPDDVTVWHDFSTPQSARDFASSSRLKEVMAKAGVKGAPQIWFVYQTH